MAIRMWHGVATDDIRNGSTWVPLITFSSHPAAVNDLYTLLKRRDEHHRDHTSVEVSINEIGDSAYRKERAMADINERKELERQINASRRELRELECCEEALLQHIPRAGFSVAVERTTMREKPPYYATQFRS